MPSWAWRSFFRTDEQLDDVDLCLRLFHNRDTDRQIVCDATIMWWGVDKKGLYVSLDH